MIDRRQTVEAELALHQRLAASPHDGESRAMLARILAQRKDSLGCARELQKIPFWWPNKAKWLLMEGTAFKQVDRMREAEAAWQAVVKDDPLHPVDGKLLNTATLDLLELFAVESRWSDAARLIWSVYDRISDPHDHEALLVMRMRTEMERITPAVAAEKLSQVHHRRPRGLGGAPGTRQGQDRPEPAGRGQGAPGSLSGPAPG